MRIRDLFMAIQAMSQPLQKHNSECIKFTNAWMMLLVKKCKCEWIRT